MFAKQHSWGNQQCNCPLIFQQDSTEQHIWLLNAAKERKKKNQNLYNLLFACLPGEHTLSNLHRLPCCPMKVLLINLSHCLVFKLELFENFVEEAHGADHVLQETRMAGGKKKMLVNGENACALTLSYGVDTVMSTSIGEPYHDGYKYERVYDIWIVCVYFLEFTMCQHVMSNVHDDVAVSVQSRS